MDPALLLAGALLVWSPPVPSQRTASTPCGFSLTPYNQPALISGPEELVPITRIVDQPGSPVAIQAVDLTDSTFVVGATWHEYEARYAIDVINVSDRPASEIRVAVRFLTTPGGGGGAAVSRHAVGPGESVRLTSAGSGHGTRQAVPEGDDRWIMVLVDSVRFDDCVYKPAQVLPARLPFPW